MTRAKAATAEDHDIDPPIHATEPAAEPAEPNQPPSAPARYGSSGFTLERGGQLPRPTAAAVDLSDSSNVD